MDKASAFIVGGVLLGGLVIISLGIHLESANRRTNERLFRSTQACASAVQGGILVYSAHDRLACVQGIEFP